MYEQNIDSLDELIKMLQAVRAKAGVNLKLNLSVMQEDKHAIFYEDRKLAPHMEVVGNGANAFLELYA